MALTRVECAVTPPTITNNNRVSTLAVAYAKACTYDGTVKQTKRFRNDVIWENRTEIFLRWWCHFQSTYTIKWLNITKKKCRRNKPHKKIHNKKIIINKTAVCIFDWRQQQISGRFFDNACSTVFTVYRVRTALNQNRPKIIRLCFCLSHSVCVFSMVFFCLDS